MRALPDLFPDDFHCFVHFLEKERIMQIRQISVQEHADRVIPHDSPVPYDSCDDRVNAELPADCHKVGTFGRHIPFFHYHLRL